MSMNSKHVGKHVAPRARAWCRSHPLLAIAVAGPLALGGGATASAATGHFGDNGRSVGHEHVLHLRPAVPMSDRHGHHWRSPAPSSDPSVPAPTASETSPAPTESASLPTDLAPSESAPTESAPAPSESAPSESTPAPTGSPSDSTPASGNVVDEVVRLTNEERSKAGCGPLTVEPHLAQSAQAHASDMVQQQYFDHTGKDGSSPFDRMQRAGFTGSAMGENIAAGQSSPQDVMTGWMNSPGHRANILNCGFNQIGVGYDAGAVQPGYGGGSWVQNFGTL